MPKIQVLDKRVAELIAAGEVIERPSSVIKELLENSIDAGATSITLDIRNGGKTMIRLTDNGCGISNQDISKAFLRHATSKISKAADLDSINSLGFRGEALASICAIAKVEILSKTADDELGFKYCISGGEEQSSGTAGCSDGTTIIVRELFYNVPARRKFLKKDATEGNAIQSVLEKIIISHPDISFKFIRDGKRIHNSPGNGKLYDAIFAIYGQNFAQSLLEVDDEAGFSIKGFSSIPMQSRVNRSMQHFFINGRYVKSKTCVTALEEAYKGSIMIGRFPACVLNIEMPFDQVDVNVHPAKIEVRFSNEQAVFEAIYFAVKQGIVQYGKINSDPEIKKQHVDRVVFKEQKHEQTVVNNTPKSFQLNQNEIAYDTTPSKTDQAQYKFLNESSFSRSNKEEVDKKAAKFDDRIIYEKTEQNKEVTMGVPEQILNKHAADSQKDIIDESRQKVPIRMIGELFKTYILAEAGGQFIIIDKHAAHERIIYEKLKHQMHETMERQLLIAPIQVSVSREEHQAAIDNIHELERLGFLIQDFGGNSILIREIPSILDQHSSKEVLENIINNILKNKHDITPNILDELYHSMSCKAAIKANDINSPEEIQELMEKVYYDDSIRYCPHGRPVVLKFTKERFEKQFGR